jgi:hypothetical protein
MKRIFSLLALSMLAVMPAGAQPQSTPRATPGVPHTEHTWLTLYKDTNYNGEDQTFETPSSTIHTDWPIRSLAIHPGDRWQICARPRFRDCIVLDRSVPDAHMVGIENQIGSARLAPDAPAAATPNLAGPPPPPRTH